MGKTLAEKIWSEHVVSSTAGEPDLLYIDLHLIGMHWVHIWDSSHMAV